MGFQGVNNFGECQEAYHSMLEIKHKGLEEENSKSYPPGCYIHANNIVYWNSHPTGLSSLCSGCRSICKEEGKQCGKCSLFFYTLQHKSLGRKFDNITLYFVFEYFRKGITV